jgi:hypothetical protein
MASVVREEGTSGQYRDERIGSNFVGVCGVLRGARKRERRRRRRRKRRRTSDEFAAVLARYVAGSIIKVQISQAASKHDQALEAPVKICVQLLASAREEQIEYGKRERKRERA